MQEKSKILPIFSGTSAKNVAFSLEKATKGLCKYTAALYRAAEGLKFGAGALGGGDPEGTGEGEAKHLHKALAVDAVLPVVQIYRERLGGGRVYEFLHITDRGKRNNKFRFIFHLTLYKPPFLVYNRGKCCFLPSF